LHGSIEITRDTLIYISSASQRDFFDSLMNLFLQQLSERW